MLPRHAGLSGKPEVADGDHALLGAAVHAIAIGEGIELLEVAQWMMRLAFDPRS